MRARVDQIRKNNSFFSRFYIRFCLRAVRFVEASEIDVVFVSFQIHLEELRAGFGQPLDGLRTTESVLRYSLTDRRASGG